VVTQCVASSDAPGHAKARVNRFFSLSFMTMACAALVACGGGGGGSLGSADGSQPARIADGQARTSLHLVRRSDRRAGLNAMVPPKATNVGVEGSVVGSEGSSLAGASPGSVADKGVVSPGLSAPSGGQRDYIAKPFASDSPWNQPIPANATYRKSDARTTAVRNAGTFGTNNSKWTIWVWQAKESEPLVSDDVSVSSLTGSDNANAGKVTIRMPANAQADPEMDTHMTIIDPDGKHAHEFWYAKKRDKGFIAVSYAKVPLDG